MGDFAERIRKLTPGVMTVLIGASLFVATQNAVAVPGGDEIAAEYKFSEQPIAMPPGYENKQMNNVRQVNPAYYHVRSWISSVGAGIAVAGDRVVHIIAEQTVGHRESRDQREDENHPSGGRTHQKRSGYSRAATR